MNSNIKFSHFIILNLVVISSSIFLAPDFPTIDMCELPHGPLVPGGEHVHPSRGVDVRIRGDRAPAPDHVRNVFTLPPAHLPGMWIVPMPVLSILQLCSICSTRWQPSWISRRHGNLHCSPAGDVSVVAMEITHGMEEGLTEIKKTIFELKNILYGGLNFSLYFNGKLHVIPTVKFLLGKLTWRGIAWGSM